MPEILVEELEIVSGFEMTAEASVLADSKKYSATKAQADTIAVHIKVKRNSRPIHVKVITSTYRNINEEPARLRTSSLNIGSILTSAIACAITKASGKPTTIEKEEISIDGRTLEAKFRIHKKELNQ